MVSKVQSVQTDNLRSELCETRIDKMRNEHIRDVFDVNKLVNERTE